MPCFVRSTYKAAGLYAGARRKYLCELAAFHLVLYPSQRKQRHDRFGYPIAPLFLLFLYKVDGETVKTVRVILTEPAGHSPNH